MGRIAVPYGLKGWVNVNPDTEMPDGLFDYPVWWVQLESGWREFDVIDAKVQGDHLVAKLDGIDDRDQAFSLKGKLLGVPREELPPAEDDEYYWSDLVGLAVENLQQVEFGTISEVFATGANDVLVVKGERERLLPFIDQVVLEVDLANKRMLVDWDAEF